MKFPALAMMVIIFFLLSGCGPKNQEIKTTPNQLKKSDKQSIQDYIFYPPLPNSPKYQYLTTFSSSKDIEKKKSKFFKFVVGKDEKKPTEIKKAYGVEIFDGIIYVCDVSNGNIVTFNLKENKFDYIGLTGSGKLMKPVNIKIDKLNKILYVADIGRKQVLAYSLTGKLLKSYGKQDQFTPVDVDHSQDKLFVCDVKAHQVHVLDKASGEMLYSIGKAGSNEGEFFHPTNIDIHEDKLYVSDTSNFRIQIFNLKGKLLSTFGEVGKTPGTFARNKGIAVDHDGRIYVVDAAFENVQVFDQKFQLLLFMFGPGIERQNINLPAAITIDYDNIKYFEKYKSPNFNIEYLLLVTSNFGINKVNVYAFGSYNH